MNLGFDTETILLATAKAKSSRLRRRYRMSTARVFVKLFVCVILLPVIAIFRLTPIIAAIGEFIDNAIWYDKPDGA